MIRCFDTAAETLLKARIIITLVLASFVAITGIRASLAEPADTYAEIIAAPLATTPFHPGYAFLCITTPQDEGVKAEYYGFFPGNKPEDVTIGCSTLSGEFKKNSVRPSRVSWSVKQKITDEQHQAFLALVERVNNQDHKLLSSNCNDFIHDVVDVFGWINVRKGLTYETYLRELYTANIKEFDYVGSSGTDFKFVRDETSWVGYKGGVHYATLHEINHNSSWIVLRWEAKRTTIRVPLKGGRYEFQTGPPGTIWNKGREVSVRF